MMNKLILTSAICLFSANVFALQCPQTLTCENSDAKSCNIGSDWMVCNDRKINLKNLNVVGIWANRYHFVGKYKMACFYESGDPAGSFCLQAKYPIMPDGSGWVFQGPQKLVLKCTTINNPSLCQGK